MEKSFMNYQIDQVDKGILRFLQKDARMAYTEIAKKLGVSSGTIHQRVHRLEEEGILLGTTVRLDAKALGLTVTTLIGIHLRGAQDHPKVIEQMKSWPELVEINYTTGSYALIVKVVTEDIDAFHKFLVKKLQTIKEIQATESFVCLSQPINRGIFV